MWQMMWMKLPYHYLKWIVLIAVGFLKPIFLFVQLCELAARHLCVAFKWNNDNSKIVHTKPYTANKNFDEYQYQYEVGSLYLQNPICSICIGDFHAILSIESRSVKRSCNIIAFYINRFIFGEYPNAHRSAGRHPTNQNLFVKTKPKQAKCMHKQVSMKLWNLSAKIVDFMVDGVFIWEPVAWTTTVTWSHNEKKSRENLFLAE